MKILNEPLSTEEILSIKNDANYIEGVIRVDLEDFIDNDLEGVMDILSEKLTDSSLLMDINYSVVGHEEHDVLLVKVTGDASSILEFD